MACQLLCLRATMTRFYFCLQTRNVFFSFQRRPSMQGLIFNSIRIVVLFWAVRWGVEQQRDRGTRLKVTATFDVCWWIINTGIFSVIPTHLTLLSICVCVWALLGNLYNWPFHQEDLKRCVKSRSCTVLHYVPLCLPVYMQTEFSPRSEKDFRVYPFWFYLSFFFLRAQRILARSVS